ncbi:MAG: hypothetical protein ACYTFQ_26020 [Planctomycetota bacterium]|jgi:hypothetical protein
MKLNFTKSITCKAAFVLGIGILVAYSFTTKAQQQRKYHKSSTPKTLLEWMDSQDKQLSVCFTANKTTFSGKETFVIRCAIRNNGNTPLVILRPFGDEFYCLSSGLNILGPAGPVTYKGAWKDYVLGTASFRKLAPSTVVDETFEIPNNLFSGIQDPGLYRIAYTYLSSGYPKKKPANFWEGKVVSSSVILLRQ